MSSAVASAARRLAASGQRLGVGGALVAALHLAALAVLWATEAETVPRLAALLAWAAVNFFWLALLRRPAVAALLSLILMVALIGLSRFKHDVLFMTVSAVDLMVIDVDTAAFLFDVFPQLGWRTALAGFGLLLAFVVVLRLDPYRVRLRTALAGFVVSGTTLAALALTVPTDPHDEFYRHQYVSKFVRSGVTGLKDYARDGVLQADRQVADRLPAASGTCTLARPPHIIMVFDESSFDITAAPGVKVPAGYRNHFASGDGRHRNFVVEGAGGPSWFTEYNVLTGLSALSYGGFADIVTRISAAHVARGLPHALRRCGYRTHSFYPYFGAFMSARRFQTQAGIEHFHDARDMRARGLEPDRFFYDAAVRVVGQSVTGARGRDPLFLFVYTAANHFPWDVRYRPDLTPGWAPTGNDAETDEYLRRQRMSADDYKAFVTRLRTEFPDERFLIVRFGDHQPSFARRLLDARLDDSLLARQIAARDPKFLTTYYAIDTVNFRPADLSSALDTLDAPYLPIVVMDAAGVPLDPSFAEQKRIMQRCRGVFYRCAEGAEVRRFNRMLIDAGLMTGL